MNRIDTSRLGSDLARAAAECAALKRALRVRWTQPMGDAQRALVRARRRATELHVLRAWLRGRLHVARAPHDGRSPDAPWDAAAFHSRIAERVARDYGLAPEPSQEELR